MKKFGQLKTKILTRITELYNNGETNEIKEIYSLIKEDENFKKLFLFYDDFENKYIDDVDVADEYLNEIKSELITLRTDIHETFNKVDILVGEIDTVPNLVYENLDILSERRKLSNIDRKVIAKKSLREHLITEKEDNKIKSFTENESLLHTIMTNNFNRSFNEVLSEEDKKELKAILSMTPQILQENVDTLKNDVLTIVDGLIKEDVSNEFSEKFEKVKNEVDLMESTKYNFFRLKSLKENLN